MEFDPHRLACRNPDVNKHTAKFWPVNYSRILIVLNRDRVIRTPRNASETIRTQDSTFPRSYNVGSCWGRHVPGGEGCREGSPALKWVDMCNFEPQCVPPSCGRSPWIKHLQVPHGTSKKRSSSDCYFTDET